MPTALQDWHDRATVRTEPAPELTFDEPGRLFYSPDLSTVLGVPQLLGEIPVELHSTILTHDLLRFHSFTVRIELGPVNHQLARLAAMEALPWLGEEARLGATRMLTDEGSHAEMSQRLMLAVERATGVERIAGKPAFLRALQHLRDQAPAGYRSLVGLLFVCVSETLITGALSRLPRDERVHFAVREVNRLHANDEAQHHKYFRELFLDLWPRLTTAQSRTLGPMLPSMLAAFLDPDLGYQRRVLTTVLPPNVSVDAIVEDALGDPAVRLSAYRAAGASLRMFEQAGVMEDSAAVDAFAQVGFIA